MGWEAGKDKSVKFTVAAGVEFTYSVIEHAWKETIDALDITSSGHAGTQALLAGIGRGDGRVKANLNTDAGKMPWVAANGIRAGNNGVLKVYVGSALFFTIPAMIKEVNYMIVIANKIEWEAIVGLNAEAGTYAYPS